MSQKASDWAVVGRPQPLSLDQGRGGLVKLAVTSKSVLSVAITALALFAGTAWAANKGSLDLLHPTDVAGTKLASGNYTVQWEGKGDQVELKIYQGKKQVASTTARVVQLDTPSQYSSAIVNTGANGSLTLSQIRFAGKKMAIEINGEGGSGGAAGSAR
jgi:hypothetical protein